MAHSTDASVLPSDLEDLIRAKLPPSDLSRYRCVCKRWRSDPDFDIVYDARPLPTAESMLVICYKRENIGSRRRKTTVLYLESSTKWFQLPLDFLPDEAYVLLAEGGGHICLKPVDGKNRHCLFICNPLTRSWRKLPNCGLEGFVYDESHVTMTTTSEPAYKVAVVGLTKSFLRTVKVYHSEKGIWTHHIDEEVAGPSLEFSRSVIENGVLYWFEAPLPVGLRHVHERFYTFNLQEATWRSVNTRIDSSDLFFRYGRNDVACSFATEGQVGYVETLSCELLGVRPCCRLWTLNRVEVEADRSSEWIWKPDQLLYFPHLGQNAERQKHECAVHKDFVFVLTRLGLWARSNKSTGTCLGRVRTIPAHLRIPLQESDVFKLSPFEPRLGICL